MRIYLLFSLSVLFLSSYSQQIKIDKVRFQVTYESAELTRPHTKTPMRDYKMLQIGDSLCKFFSISAERYQNKKDSLFALGYTANQVMTLLANEERSKDNHVIIKGYPDRNHLTFLGMIGKNFSYQERSDSPKWEIVSEYKDILGYKCQKAKAAYKGRNWIAWFAQEIPLSSGPWKLYGLPGLILMAEDEKQEFVYTCIGLTNEDGEEVSMTMRDRKYIRTTKNEFMKLLKEAHYYPDKTISKIYGAEIKLVSPDTQERSYNPIEF